MADTNTLRGMPNQSIGETLIPSGSVVANSPVTRAEIQELQSLAVIGELAEVVAHDFNNIVSATLIHLGLLLQDPAFTAEQKESLTTLAKETTRAAGLTRQLLSFSRHRCASNAETVDLNSAIAEILKLLTHLVRKNVTVSFEPSSDECWIRADVGQVEKLLISICLLLREEMPNGGEMTLVTRRELLDETREPASALRAGNFICLSLMTSGMSHENTLRASSCSLRKDKESGFGWKLTAAREIAQSFNGWIAVNRDTTFLEVQVYFPVPTQSQANVENSSEITGGTETILLVKDEAFLRRVSALSLRKLGYAVLDASDGIGAQKLWDKHQSKIDLLLTDILLPGSDTGYDLAKLFCAQKPTLRVMLCSGNHVELNEFAGQQFYSIVKPYSGSSLAKRVRECLDSSL